MAKFSRTKSGKFLKLSVAALLLALLVLGGTAALYMTQQNQEIRQQAYSVGNTSGPKDTVAPNVPVVRVAEFDGARKARFSWSWTGDNTCSNCEGPVQWCDPATNTPYGSFDPTNNATPNQPPACSNFAFWYQVVSLYTDGRPGSQVVSAAPSFGTGLTYYDLDCSKASGSHFRLDVRAKDARNNASAFASPVYFKCAPPHPSTPTPKPIAPPPVTATPKPTAPPPVR